MLETPPDSPPLTVGLPVYNGEAYLAEALDSILAQSFSDFVLVISDNASTDATGQICRSYAAADSRVSYHVQSKNMGGAWNYNRVFELSASPFFKWISHDDVTGEGFLESCMEQIQTASEDVALCYPRAVLIDGSGKPIEEFDDNLDLRQEQPHARLRCYLDNYRMSNPLFGVFRACSLRRTALHGAYSSSDKVLLAEVALLGQFWELPQRRLFRRYHDGMSRKANVTPDEVASWFDPNNPRPVSMQRARLFVEYSKAIMASRLGISPRERVFAMRELAMSTGMHGFRVIAGEMKREAKARITRSARGVRRRT